MKVNIEKLLVESMLRYELRNILLEKNISNEKIMYASNRASELIELTDGLDAKAYIFLGKIKYIGKQYKDARTAFLQAKQVNPILPSAYYGLFKLGMDSEKYEIALENITMYQKYSDIDCSIYINLISKKLNKESIYLSPKDEIMGVKNLPKNIMTNYNLAINAINEEDYSKALKHINVCRKLLSIKNIKIDLKYMSDILIKLVEISNNKKRNEDIALLTNVIVSSNNCGQKYLALTKLFELNPTNINVILMLIDICLELRDITQATYYLEIGKKINSKIPKIMYYEQIINEVSDNSEVYMESVSVSFKVDTELENGNLNKALKICTEYLEENNDPQIIYKSGVVLFKIGNYVEAEKMFFKYLALSSLSQKEAYYFLYYISLFLGDTLKNEYYLKATYDISKYVGNSMSESDWNNILLSYKENFDELDIKAIDKLLIKDELKEKNKVKIKQV